MEKIALVAPHHIVNYGTLLQAYALAKVINDYGYICEYISYNPIEKKRLMERVINKVKRILLVQKSEKTVESSDNYLYSTDFDDLRRVAYYFYSKYIPHSQIVYTPKTLNKCVGYRKYIVGSDQSWSMVNYDKSSFYFLPFVKEKTKKNAYAPSLGNTHLSKTHLSILLKYLPDFAYLSCREKSNSDLLSCLLSKHVEYVLDPTLLFEKAQWDEFACNVELPSRYILAYILGEKKCISIFAEEWGKCLNIPVFYIVTRPEHFDKSNILRALSPQQWVFAFSHATGVVTDSFHGTLFSLIFNRSFYVFNKRDNVKSDTNDNDRLLELLSMYNLENHLIKDDTSFSQEHNDIIIDYKKVNNIIAQQRIDSLSYIKKII